MSIQDNATITNTLMLASEAGRRFNAYLARPDGARAAGVLLLHDMFGLHGVIRAVADRFARLGYAALVPNMFWRSENPDALAYDQHALAWPRLKAVDLDVASADMASAVSWLRAQSFSTGKVAAVGFCGGGRWAYLAAARSGVDAAASLYGLGISQHLSEVGNVKCPLQLHYGLKDEHVPQQEIDAVTGGVRGHPSMEVFLYPGAGHSFANPIRPTYDPAAAELAHQRIERMLAGM
jgi:carboxymethylenebutenolidase